MRRGTAHPIIRTRAPSPSGVATARTATVTSARIVAWARANWAVLAVFGAFALSAVIVPTFAPVATTDDWAYTRSAQILLAEGRLTVFPVVAATAVFQIVWGALFGFLLGPTFGAFRLSTVVITALGAVALYGLCRDLGVTRGRGALGVAAYLFNPLVFVLAFTFMTDAHFVGLLMIATWLFAKALALTPLPPSPTAVRRGGTEATNIVPGGNASSGDALISRPDGSQGEERGETASNVTYVTSERAREPFSLRIGPGTRLRVAVGVRVSRRSPSPDPTGEGFGVRVSPIDARFILAGSIVAGLAFLTRQQGALIVPAVIAFLLLSRRLRFDRASAVLLLQLLVPSLLAIGGYYLWLRYGNDVPHVQASFFREVLEEGWGGTWWLLRHLTAIELIYLGFFTLPLMAAALPFVRTIGRGIPPRGWLLFALWEAIAVAGVAVFWTSGARMPYIPQFFGSGGLGAPDVLGSRPILISPDVRALLTAICLIASLLLALIAARAMGAAPSLTRSRAALVLMIGLGQVVGVLPPSYHYIGWAAGSLDRYLLPLVPLAIAVTLWGLRDVRLVPPLGWIVAIALACFAVAGTRDYLVFMRAIWAMGDKAVAAGVPLDRLDAGSGWDGYYLYERGLETRLRSRTPKGGPWWVYFYAPATDSAYVVSGKQLRGYFVVAKAPYSSWLQRAPTTLYLLRRLGMPWPPKLETGQGSMPVAIQVRPAPGGLETLETGSALPVPTVDAKNAPRTGPEDDNEQ